MAAVATSQHAQAQSAAPTGPSGTGNASSCPSSNPPNELVLAGGTPQTAQLATGFANPLQVELANTNGCPITTAVTGVPITFTAPASGPSATFAASGSNTLTVGADATGSASAQMLTANDTAGAYTVTATSAYGSVSFALTNTAAGIPATITPLAPISQHATAGSRYAQPLAVRVLDANGNPVVGATVTFSLGSAGNGGGGAGASGAAGASFDDGTSQAAETTDADGVATSPGFTANATSGAFTATATVQHVTEPARFTLDNLAAKPRTITPVGVRASPTATVGTRYARSLRVTVRGADGRPGRGRDRHLHARLQRGRGRLRRQWRGGRHLHRWLDPGHRHDRPARHRDLPAPRRQRRSRRVHGDRTRNPGPAGSRCSTCTTTPDRRPAISVGVGHAAQSTERWACASRSRSRSPSPTPTATRSPTRSSRSAAPVVRGRAAALRGAATPGLRSDSQYVGDRGRARVHRQRQRQRERLHRHRKPVERAPPNSRFALIERRRANRGHNATV